MANYPENNSQHFDDVEENLELPDFGSNNSFNEDPNLDDLEQEYNQYKDEEFVNPSNDNNNYNNLQNTSTSNNNKYTQQFEESKLNAKISQISFLNDSGNESNGTNNINIPAFHEHTLSFREYYRHDLKEYFSWSSVGNYCLSIFPVVKWLPHYNYIWFIQDLIAGITIGCVLVPQSMSYAQIATLPPQYGLYSSFIGAFIYSLFATSKDVCIGPVAVMSLETAKVIARVTEKLSADTDITAPIIATTLAFLCGIIALGVGMLRLGFLVELISLNAVSGFMTGSALNIISGQVPSLMGYSSKLNTRQSTYKVIIETLKHLPDTKLDAVFGLIPLVILYTWKWWCNNMGPKLAERHFGRTKPRLNYYLQKFYFYAQACRNAIVIIVFTCISWAITRGKTKAERKIKILGTVPSGLKDVGVFELRDDLMSKVAPELPASVIVLLLEHISIAKSFGRVNDYKIVPDQELIAIGVTNLLGTFFMAYPATGSFSRSALKAKCNVKTPFSGIISGACVLLALYCLTSAFFYIPSATLSAVIIHAVSDLVASYHTTWNFWKMNPLDCLSFIVTVFITVFSSIENGIYFAMCWSAALLILKVTFPAGKFLGYIQIAEVVNGNIVNDPSITVSEPVSEDEEESEINNKSSKFNQFKGKMFSSSGKSAAATKEFNSDEYKKNLYETMNESETNDSTAKLNYYTKWVPFDHAYTKELNPDCNIIAPPPGVIVYRLSDSYTYLNCSRHFDIIFDEVKKQTKRGKLIQHSKKSDRPWNDPGPWEPPTFHKGLLKKGKQFFSRNKSGNNEDTTEVDINPNVSLDDNTIVDERPLLKIICLDFSQVSQVDANALQSLVDLRKAINKYADRQVEFHFAGITSPWVKRGLENMQFGKVNEEFSDESIITGHTSYHLTRSQEKSDDSSNLEDSFEDLENRKTYQINVATGTNLPFFHIDIPNFSKWNI